MSEKTENTDEISLIDLFAVILKHIKMILITGLTAVVGSVIFSIITIVLPPDVSPLPNKYTPVATMRINDSTSQGGGLSSMISASGLGGLASIAGISSKGSSFSSFAQYLVGSNLLLDSVVDNFGLIEKWEIKKSPRANSRKMLKKLLVASYDDESGVFSISYTDKDPVLAQQIVNYSVDYVEKIFSEMGLDKNILEKKNLEENIQSCYDEILRLQKEIQKLENSVSNVYSPSDIPSITFDTASAVACSITVEPTLTTGPLEHFSKQKEALTSTLSAIFLDSTPP